jgi:phospho-2-dehydro-3-deoxyheptonate aldolase
MPVGFKKHGQNIAPAVNAISAALHPHRFLGSTAETSDVVSTTGNQTPPALAAPAPRI